MFERMVELTEPGAVRSRKSYFVVSAIVMGILAITGVVVSIYADDYSLNASIELAELIAPVEMAQVAPEQPQPRQSMPRTQQSTSEPTRTVAQAQVDDTHAVPTTISTTPNTHLSIPNGHSFVISNVDSNPSNTGGEIGPGSGRGAASDQGSLTTQAVATSQPEEGPAPRDTKPKTHQVVSIGVANGKAIYLPKPAYPPAAQAVGAGGTVEVQVLIDENGRVLSAHAASGSVLLRAAAERAAMSAKFTPTLLSNVPVKVSGIITYNFLKS